MIKFRGLPDKDLYRIDEAAQYFGTSPRTIHRWIQHGHLEKEKIVGSIRITRDAIIRCRFRKQAVKPDDAEESLAE